MPKTVRTRRTLAGATMAPKRKPIVPTVAQRNAVFDSVKKNLDEFIELDTKNILKIADGAIAAYEKVKK